MLHCCTFRVCTSITGVAGVFDGDERQQITDRYPEMCGSDVQATRPMRCPSSEPQQGQGMHLCGESAAHSSRLVLAGRRRSRPDRKHEASPGCMPSSASDSETGTCQAYVVQAPKAQHSAHGVNWLDAAVLHVWRVPLTAAGMSISLFCASALPNPSACCYAVALLPTEAAMLTSMSRWPQKSMQSASPPMQMFMHVYLL